MEDSDESAFAAFARRKEDASGNTDAEDPSALGGGETGKHLIYEGLSRVTADAVMAGGNTIRDGSVVFSVWHPALVALRGAFGKPRHPVQIVVTASGDVAIEDGLLFNVADLSVLILMHVYAKRLFGLGIRRVSVVGGRTLATGLIDAGLISDLYLTTSPIEGGRPGTPLYAGTRTPTRELVVRKRSSQAVLFEHVLLRAD